MDGIAPGFVALVVVAVATVAVVAVVLHFKAERERREAMRAFAARMGFDFTEANPGLDARLRDFSDFGKGHSRTGLNLASGHATLGGVRMSVLLGDYRYKITSGSGKSRSTKTYDLSFVSVVPVLAIREELAVRSENFLDRIGAAIGFDDIDFESSEFSKRFHVKCSDRRFAFDLFDPRMMEYFLERAPYEVEAHRGILVFDRGTRRWEPHEFEAALGWIDGFFARIPRHVRADRLPPSERASDPILNPTGPAGQGESA